VEPAEVYTSWKQKHFVDGFQWNPGFSSPLQALCLNWALTIQVLWPLATQHVIAFGDGASTEMTELKWDHESELWFNLTRFLKGRWKWTHKRHQGCGRTEEMPSDNEATMVPSASQGEKSQEKLYMDLGFLLTDLWENRFLLFQWYFFVATLAH
jgi:hypothetical protein